MMPANPIPGGGGGQGGVPPGVGVGIGGQVQWFVIPNPGFPFDLGIVASILGIHGRYALEQSATRPGGAVAGPFNTKDQANTWISTHNPLGLPRPLSPLASVGDFLGRLGEASTWIRVAEVVLGLALIVVGVARLASGTAAGKAALKAGEAAAIL